MDNRTFTARLARHTDLDQREAAQLVSAIAAIIGDCAADSDSVAIPGFGSFESVKKQEYIDTDEATGARTLMPPSIKVSFKPGTRLKKSVAAL